jgi:hypothetical protein
MSADEPLTNQQALFDVVVYLVNSASTSLGETPSLAAFRMLDAASRILALIEPGNEDEAAFLDAMRSDYDQHFNLVMTDQEAFQRWLPDHVRICTREAMRRIGVDTTTGTAQ